MCGVECYKSPIRMHRHCGIPATIYEMVPEACFGRQGAVNKDIDRAWRGGVPDFASGHDQIG
jgi:hypothetical protein